MSYVSVFFLLLFSQNSFFLHGLLHCSSDHFISLNFSSQINDYVFPSDKGAGHLVDPHKALVKIRELSGVQFNIHDLRRTFITLAESLNIPVYALKKLLNHKTTADVTAGYIIMDVERLRTPMQMITDKLVELMHLEFNTD